MLDDNPFAFFLDGTPCLVTIVIAECAFVEWIRQYLPDTGRRPEAVAFTTNAVVVQVLRQLIGTIALLVHIEHHLDNLDLLRILHGVVRVLRPVIAERDIGSVPFPFLGAIHHDGRYTF